MIHNIVTAREFLGPKAVFIESDLKLGPLTMGATRADLAN